MTDLSRLDSWRAVDVQNWLIKEAEDGNLSPIIEKHSYVITDRRLDGRKVVEMTSEDFDRLRDVLEEDGLSRYSVGKIVEAVKELRTRSARARNESRARNENRGSRRRRDRYENGSVDNDRMSNRSFRSNRSDRYREDDVVSHRSYGRHRDDDVLSHRSGRSGRHSRHRDRASDVSGPPYSRSQPSVISDLTGVSVPRSRWAIRSFCANREDAGVRDLRANVQDWKRVVEGMEAEYQEKYQKLLMVLSGISRFYGDHADRRRTHLEYLKIGKTMKSEFKDEKKWDEVERMDDVLTRLAKSKETLDKLRRMERRNPSPLLKMLFGDISVRCYRKGDLLGLKEAYNNFQLGCLPGFFILPVLMVLTGLTVQVNCLLQLFLMVYHAGTAIRMSILQQHGANIPYAWIKQNYIAIAGAVITMVTPASSPVIGIACQLVIMLLYNICQGAFILMKHVHLSKKLQAEIAEEQVRLAISGKKKSVRSDSSQYLPPRFLLLTLGIGAFLEVLLSIVILGFAITGNLLSLLHGILLFIMWLYRGVYNLYILKPKAPDFSVKYVLKAVQKLVMISLREVCNSVLSYLWPKQLKSSKVPEPKYEVH